MRLGKNSRHILFAESEQGLERSISLMLKMANFQVTVVADCIDAYDKLIEFGELGEQPDLLIIDFGRKVEISERFVQSFSDSNLAIPLIIISEYGDEGLIAESLARQSVMCLSKPFEPQELIQGIEQVLNQ